MKETTSRPRFTFNTVGLFTHDNKATVDFYTKTFGFTTDWDGIQPNVEMTLGNISRGVQWYSRIGIRRAYLR